MRGVSTVIAELTARDPEDIFVSSLTSFELYTGVEKCANPGRERIRVENLLNTLRQIEFDLPAAKYAALIRADLESRGEMIGPYDVLLAGQAISMGFTLVTNNIREFSRINKILLADWRSTES